MEALFHSSTVERTTEKRLRMPWGKKANPLTTSNLFNKSKHSEEWHQSIDATAGVLHPSDPKFPWSYIRSHTDTYLKKKGKINQADADIRLAILIDAHDAKDVAFAAAAHVMTAKSLRALLYADLNVAHGSYWGLKTWLQCLIAANDGNPASVTDLEALWARKLLPFATQGPRAAEWYLVGVSRTLREMSLPHMNILPEFSSLLNRAITDHLAQLEGYRLRNEWDAARESALWMMELARTSPPVTPPGHLLPEHIFDAQFPAWRMWAKWQPRVDRIALLANLENAAMGILSDLIALEGPDILTGSQNTLREGLITQYGGEKAFVRYRGIVVHVADSSKGGLGDLLERTARAMEHLCSDKTFESSKQSRLMLFRDLLVAKPITKENLDIFDATIKIRMSSIDPCITVQQIYTHHDELGGEDVSTLHDLIQILDHPCSDELRPFMFQPWLFAGIEQCLQDCRTAVRSHINNHLPWTDLALEFHGFCDALKTSKHELALGAATVKALTHLPPAETMGTVIAVYEAAIKQQTDLTEYFSHNSTEKEKEKPSGSQIKRVPLQSSSVEAEKSRHPLQKVIEEFCVDRLLEHGTLDQISARTTTAILMIWKNTATPTIDTNSRDLAILVTGSIRDNTSLRLRCLAEIVVETQSLATESFTKDMVSIMRQSSTDISKAIVAFTNLLYPRKAWTQCWKDLLYMWLEQQCPEGSPRNNTVLEYSLQTMKAAEWLLFVEKIETLFGQTPASSEQQQSVPPILSPTLLAWRSQVAKCSNTLTRLETVLIGNVEPVRCILACNTWGKNLLRILGCLRGVEGTLKEPLMQRVVSKLSAKERNDWEIRECCLDLAVAKLEWVEFCEMIWDAHHGRLDIPGLPDANEPGASNDSSKDASRDSTATGVMSKSEQTRKQQSYDVPPAVVEVMVAGWVQDESLHEDDKKAVLSLANLLKIEVHHLSVPEDTLKKATAFWEKIETEIIKEAERLEGLQKALKAKDPKGTAILLKELSIPDSSPLDEEILKLPVGVVDLVERIGTSEVEISFPVSAFTELQRNAMGIRKGANNILVRLFIDYTGSRISPQFCVHFDNDKNLEDMEHSPWTCKKDSSAPQRHVCNSPQTAFIWQLNRILHMQLRDGDISLVDLYTRVNSRIQQLGHACVSCGVSHVKNAKNVQMRRSTPCNLLACAQLWYKLPLDVRIPELRTDIFAVDAMLMSVHAAAMSGRPEFLPSCPIRNVETVKAILNSLPSITVISHAVNMSIVLKSYHPDAEKLISWACVHHRGYIATATGICKVPSLPNVHQFILANASPRLETEYVAKLPRYNPKTTVLFHGTTFDRLPAILSQGLRVCSGTALQRTGAAHGKGIYLAEEPATSLTYSPVTMSWRNSCLSNTRLLLGCEVVGSGRKVSGTIHVVTDEKSVMVRYIFLLPSDATAPIANHIVPAMASGMNAMRAGVV